jgi:hypothetical protein
LPYSEEIFTLLANWFSSEESFDYYLICNLFQLDVQSFHNYFENKGICFKNGLLLDQELDEVYKLMTAFKTNLRTNHLMPFITEEYKKQNKLIPDLKKETYSCLLNRALIRLNLKLLFEENKTSWNENSSILLKKETV